MKSVISEPSHYLGHEQTFSLMKTEYHYPSLSDRNSTDMWTQAGEKDMMQVDREHVQRTLSSHFNNHIPEDIDKQLRSRFNISLPKAEMCAATSR